MLINLRNALMAGKRLPYDAEVEYLGGGSVDGGIAFVDTGYMPNSSTRIEATAAMLTGSAFSGRYGNGARLTFGSGNNQLYSAQGGHYFFGSFTTGRYYSFVNDIQNRTVSVDGATPTSTSAVANWYSQSYPFYLFVSNVAPTSGSIVIAGHSIDPSSVGGMRIASCRIYDNNILVRDFIPVRKGTVGYLYDRVSGKLFGNAGTGDFVLGQDVVPVEYLQSSGTQWIDTGVIPTAADSFYCRIRQSVVADQCLWGLASVAYCFSNWTGVGSGNGTFWGHPAIGTGGVQGVNPLGDTNWHEILCQPSGIFVDGVQINTQVTAPTLSPLNTVALFARSVNSAGGGVTKYGRGRMSAFKVERNGDPLRKYFPVRVGTEGAMMDVLTRRIYRNAGTGAFTYGNDLKYPIPAE